MILLGLAKANAQTYPFQVKISGKGPKNVILIPGYGCSGDVWNQTVQSLGENYKCYVLTMPGFAGVKAQQSPEISDWVKSIAQYIQNEKISKPIVVGHSLGGVMAQWIAADYPSLVSGVVVVDALPCLPALSNPAFKVSPAPDFTPYANHFKALSDQQFAQTETMAAASLSADTAAVPLIASWGIHSDRATLGVIYGQLMNTDLRPKLSAISCPVLVMLEPSFKAISSSIEGQYKDLKTAKLVYATKDLHFIMYDDKDWYLQQLKNFLQQ